MPDFDAKSWIAAGKRYALLRRRYWRWYLSGSGVAVGFAVIVGTLGRHISEPVRTAVGWVVGIVILFWVIMIFRVWLALMRFRCPRCGEPFGVIGWRWRCGSCTLDLAAAAKAL
jgi:hypothetical protein